MTTTPQEPGQGGPADDPDVNPSSEPTTDDPVPGSGPENPGDPA